ncbi:MAG: hypothetical protein JWN72_2687 [Thermoleophilia bacterium]|nr:hypothetical protein [Thermoleophilia bacterium]
MKVSKRTIAIGVACAALGSLGGGYAVAGPGSDVATKGSSADEDHGDKGEGRHEELTGTTLSKASDAALTKVGEGKVTETERGDHGTAFEVEVTKDDGSQVDVELDAAFVVTAVKADAPEANDASGEGDDEADGANRSEGDDGESKQELTGSDLAKASKAALGRVGEGKVTKTEKGDDGEAAFEVEVTKDDGSQVDVELDASFAVTAANLDIPEAGDHAD